MEWFFKPKVQLGLFVNFVFLLFTWFNSTHAVGPRLYVADGEAGSQTVRRIIPHVPLPPPAAPSRASVAKSGDLVTVYLNNDLTLVRKPGRTLTLSPTFSTHTQPPALPLTASLRFIVFSEDEVCPGPCPFVINADGERAWTSDAGHALLQRDWKRERIPASKSKLPDGQVVETLASETLTTEVPYELFIQIISAARVIIRLGPDEVELTADQIDALRDMHRRLPPQEPTPNRAKEPKLINAF